MNTGISSDRPVEIFLALARSRRGFFAPAILGLAIMFTDLPPVRAVVVSVVPVNSELGATADLLGSHLSTLTNVTVLERAQLQKVLQEQSLALWQSGSWIKAGRLQGAQGLILLEKGAGESGKEFLSVRVIAAAPGVVVLENRFALPVTNLSDWTSNYLAQLQSAFPKLSVRPDEAVAVSVTSLRYSVANGEAGSVEAELTGLLRLRLAQEPAVFILERRHLEELATEKRLMPEEEPFWNGAVIVEGTINRDGLTPGVITIHARATAPQKPAVELAVTGARNNLPGLADELTARILTALGRKGALPAWRTEAEAEQFLRDAEWAARWGLWRQAAHHADAAWYLGKQTPLVGAYRITGRAWQCLEMRGNASYDYVGPYGFQVPPRPEAFSVLEAAMEIYRESFDRFTHATNSSRDGWAGLGLDLLLVSARLLDRYQERPELMDGQQAALRELRANCRGLSDLLTTKEAPVLTGWRRDLQGLPSVFGHTREGPVATISAAWLDARAAWCETPLEALVVFRKLVHSPSYGLLRGHILARELPLVAWSVPERVRLTKTWCDFGLELTGSSNLQVRMDGWRTILLHGNDPQVLETAAEGMLGEAVKNQARIFSEGIEAPVELTISNSLRRIARWDVPATEQKLQAVREAARTLLDEVDPEFSYLIWKSQLAAFSNSNTRSWSFRRPSGAPPPERLQELIEGFEFFERNERTKWQAGQHLQSLRAYAPPSRPAPAPRDGSNPDSSNASGVLEFSRVWHLGLLRLPADRTADPSMYRTPFRKASWQEGNLWLEIQTYGADHQGASPRLANVKLDPATMQSEVFLNPFESFEAPPSYSRRVLAAGREFFVSGRGAIWRHSSGGNWTNHPVPAEFGGTPVRWGRRIALSAQGVILDFDPETASVRLLASARRTPAASVLDSQALGLAPLAVWPDDTLCALVEGQVWRMSPGDKDWRLFASATNCGQSLELQTQGVIFRQAGRGSVSVGSNTRNIINCGPQLLGGWRPNRSVLDYHTWNSGRASAGIVSEIFTPPYWRHPAGSFPHDSQAQFDGANVWVFPAPAGAAHFEGEPPAMNQFGASRPGTNYVPKTILFLDGARNETLELAIRFTGAASDWGEAYEQHHAQGRHHVEFLHTEQGLAIVVNPAGVIFWAPRAEVDSVLAAARSRALPGYGKPSTARAKFDQGRKGWLDDTEARAWRRDPAVIREWAQSSDTAIRQHAVEWDKLFIQLDRNGDGRLSGAELDIAVNQRPEIFARRLAGLNSGAAQVMRLFNLDRDLGLDQKEFRLFLAEPRLLAEAARSTDWLQRFGLDPAIHDTNDDGVLDAAERDRLLQTWREQPARR
jgi:hypothetical protein